MVVRNDACGSTGMLKPADSRPQTTAQRTADKEAIYWMRENFHF